MSKSIFLMLVICFAFPMYANDSSNLLNQNWIDFLVRYQEMEEDITVMLEYKPSCSGKRKFPSNKKCTYFGFCKYLENNSNGGNSSALYTDKMGQILPNYRLYNISAEMQMCYQNKQRKLRPFKPPQKSPNDALTKLRERIHQLDLDFYQAVLDTKSQDKYIKFQMAVTEVEYLQDGQQEQSLPEVPFGSKEYFEFLFDKYQNKAGVKLPDVLRQKFVEQALLTYELKVEYSKQSFLPIPEIRHLHDNPFMNFFLFLFYEDAGGLEKLKEYQSQYRAEAKRIEEIYDNSKSEMLKYFESKIESDSSNKKIYKEMIKRIETVRLNFSLTDFDEHEKSCLAPNAYYMPNHHHITICPQLMQLPTPSIQAILLHEIAHSIDPCMIAQPLIKATDLELHEQIQRPLPREDFVPMDLPEKKYNEVYTLDLYSQANVVLKGGYKNYKKEIFSEGVDYSKNPFSKTMSCLSQEDSVAARIDTHLEAKEKIGKSIERLEQSDVNENNQTYLKLKEAYKNFDKMGERLGGCSHFSTSGQIQEEWSDWLATEIMGKKIKEMNDDDKYTYAFESFLFNLSMSCEIENKTFLDKISDFFKKSECYSRPDFNNDEETQIYNTIRTNDHYLEDMHSLPFDRVEKVFVSHPELKKALGCYEDSGGEYCE